MLHLVYIIFSLMSTKEAVEAAPLYLFKFALTFYDVFTIERFLSVAVNGTLSSTPPQLSTNTTFLSVFSLIVKVEL